MTEGLDFTNDEGFNPTAWENLDAKQISDELKGVTSRINNVSTLLDKMVYKNDYDNTERFYRKLYTEDLSASGFVPLFISNNQAAFGAYPDENQAPPWYSGLSVDKKKIFDQCHRYYNDVRDLAKPMQMLGRLMLAMALKDSFRFMRTTLNFDEAGYDRDMFDKIKADCQHISDLLNASFSGLEANAPASKRYVDEHKNDAWNDSVKEGYRKARLRDYHFEMELRKFKDRFVCRDNGKFSVDSGWLADMKVIDKYTTQISTLPNIEDNMKKTQEDLGKVSELLTPIYAKIKSPEAIALMDAVYTLKDKIYEYTVGGLNVYTCFKNRDNDAPYCFVQKMASFRAAYGFAPHTDDPWHSGTSYMKLYEQAARALEDHCEEFVKRRGVVQL